MKSLNELILSAKADENVWITDIRKAFASDTSAKKAVIRLEKLDGEKADYLCPVPAWETEEEYGFLRDYLSDRLYNVLSVYSGRSVTVFCDSELKELFESVISRFHTETGYKKVINIARRLTGAEPTEKICSMSEYVQLPEKNRGEKADIAARVRTAVETLQHGTYCGIDIGGTDIKLAASYNGRLVAVKEYDWNPSLFLRSGQIKAPVILLARLMSACVENARGGNTIDMSGALDRSANHETMEYAVNAVEERFGKTARFDGLQLSFPDIVIKNRIMGGETPKTAGIRSDPTADYEAELLSLSKLNDELLCVADKVVAANDGHIATFSALVEHAYSDAADVGAVIAHSLGTDLGTGWIDDRGEMPTFPLECYDLLFDLGSEPSKRLPPEDMRSLKNENSGMAGARRYLGQAAVYRLMYLSRSELICGFTDDSRGFPEIAMHPEDMRKPCLAHIMKLASEGDSAAESAFRQVGINLAQITQEIEYITGTDIDSRWLFGRFVKDNHCFELICEGFASVLPDKKLVSANEDMAATPLMRQLAEREDVTVAQFAQAVSGLYFCEYT